MRRTATRAPTCGTSPPTWPGSKAAYDTLAPAVKAKDAALNDKIEAGFADVQAQIKAYADGVGLPALQRADGGRRHQDEDVAGGALGEPGHGGRRARPPVSGVRRAPGRDVRGIEVQVPSWC